MTAVVPAAFSGLKRSFIASNDSLTVTSASSIGNNLRERYRDRGPLVQRGLGVHGAVQGRGHAIVHHGRTQPRPALRTRCREEGLEYAGLVLRLNTGDMIPHHMHG